MTQSDPLHIIPFRDVPVDLLRGFAITIMVAANLIPFLLQPPAPYWLRLVASVAAPLFIFLSGMMVALSCRMKNHTLSYFIIRGGFVVVVAALLDLLVRGSVPFIDTDVLYLIGLSLPLAYAFLSLSLRIRAGIIVAILAATPLLQHFAGYSQLPLQVPLFVIVQGGALPGVMPIICQWFIDGWFPIFPWLALSLLGAQAGTFRWKGDAIVSFAQPKLIVLAGSILVLGAIFWYLIPGASFIRFGYVELFYPPTVEFLFFITGLIFCLFAVADSLPVANRIFDPIRALGECSLAIYILHTFVIEVLISPLDLQVPVIPYLTGAFILIGSMVLAAYLIRHIRQNYRTRSFVIRVLIGG
jgi:uncharacterized membrane protein